MAIELGSKTVQIASQDRTFEFTVSTPPDGEYVLSIFRHVIDKNTGVELSRDAHPLTLSKAEMLADPDVRTLLIALPALLDRIVTAKRAQAAAQADS